MRTRPRVSVDVHVDLDDARREMMSDMRRALTARQVVLAPKWLYDDEGSDLFDQITRLPEYYPTEAERSLLDQHAVDIALTTGADTVVELGSGTSDKTRTLLDAFHDVGQLDRFVPFDVSEATLVDAAHMLAERYDGLEVNGVVGDFTRHLRAIPGDGNRVVAFLGGTLGNLYVEERHAILGMMADGLDEGEWLLLGVDLVKPIGRIIAAYRDEDGITERFIKNVLLVLNERLEANFDVDGFDYVPMWDGREERVDMRLRSTIPQTVRFDALDMDREFAAGEELHVEISTKFRRDRLTVELTDAGFEVRRFWANDLEEFALVLARKATDSSPAGVDGLADGLKRASERVGVI